jgi:hypothetical protein
MTDEAANNSSEPRQSHQDQTVTPGPDSHTRTRQSHKDQTVTPGPDRPFPPAGGLHVGRPPSPLTYCRQ